MIAKRLICEIRFKPTLLYYDIRVKLAHELREEYPDYAYSRDQSILKIFNKQFRKKIVLQAWRAAIVYLNETNPPSFFDSTQKILKKYCDQLKVKALDRIGIRFQYLEEKQISFEELRETIRKVFYKDTMDEIIAPDEKTTDIACHVFFEERGYKHNLLFGPVSRDGILQRFWDEDFKAEDRKQLPRVALLVDVDCYRYDVSPGKIVNIFRFSQKITPRLFNSIAGRLT